MVDKKQVLQYYTITTLIPNELWLYYCETIVYVNSVV